MLPICPAVLEHEDAESLFKALQDKHLSGLIQTFDCNKHNTIFHAFMYISMHGHVLVDSNKTL